MLQHNQKWRFFDENGHTAKSHLQQHRHKSYAEHIHSIMGVRNGVFPNEFVFQKSWAMAFDFTGIQTHKGKLRYTWAAMIDSICPQCFPDDK